MPKLQTFPVTTRSGIMKAALRQRMMKLAEKQLPQREAHRPFQPFPAWAAQELSDRFGPFAPRKPKKP